MVLCLTNMIVNSFLRVGLTSDTCGTYMEQSTMSKREVLKAKQSFGPPKSPFTFIVESYEYPNYCWLVELVFVA